MRALVLSALMVATACDDAAESSAAPQAPAPTPAPTPAAAPTPAPEPAAPPPADDDSGGPPPEAPAGELRVAVRVHLLEGARAGATIDEGQVHAIMAEVDEVWAQAEIGFDVERVVTQPMTDDDEYADFLDAFKASRRRKKSPEAQALTRRRGPMLRRALPRDERIPTGIDVYVLRRLPGLGGVRSCPANVVVWGEREHGSEARAPSAVLAHELGHALGLHHVPCAAGGNLMMEPCPDRAPEDVPLDPEQIATARRFAATGRPKSCRGEQIEED